MPERATSLTGAAGEHYVAYVLSALGFPVGLTRGGSPTVDILVSDVEGKKSISIQVKTSNWAWRKYSKKVEHNHWEWDVGAKGKTLSGDSIFYAFVDLRWDESKSLSENLEEEPVVFIVPSEDVEKELGDKNYSRYMFWILENDPHRYRNNWNTIIKDLQKK